MIHELLCIFKLLSTHTTLREFFWEIFIKPDKEWIQPADVNTCGSSKGPEPLKTT